VTLLTRDPARAAVRYGTAVRLWSSLDAWQPEVAFDAAINLAGAPIANLRRLGTGRRLGSGRRQRTPVDELDSSRRLDRAGSAFRNLPHFFSFVAYP